MTKNILKKLHKSAAIIALILIAVFETSTIFAEIFATSTQISFVKSTILLFVPVLMLAMMVTGISASKLYTGPMKGVFKVKQTRMKIAAINGVVILLPATFVLAKWAKMGQFDTLYWTIQIVEICVGIINLSMISLNIRDGIRLGRGKNSAI